jgi:hypothetical protein
MIQKLRAFHWSNNVQSTHCSVLLHCTLHIYSIKFTQLLSSRQSPHVLSSCPEYQTGSYKTHLGSWTLLNSQRPSCGQECRTWWRTLAHALLQKQSRVPPGYICVQSYSVVTSAFPVLMRQCWSQNMVISLHKHKCHIDHKDIRNVKFLCLIDSRLYHLCSHQLPTTHFNQPVQPSLLMMSRLPESMFQECRTTRAGCSSHQRPLEQIMLVIIGYWLN